MGTKRRPSRHRPPISSCYTAERYTARYTGVTYRNSASHAKKGESCEVLRSRAKSWTMLPSSRTRSKSPPSGKRQKSLARAEMPSGPVTESHGGGKMKMVPAPKSAFAVAPKFAPRSETKWSQGFVLYQFPGGGVTVRGPAGSNQYHPPAIASATAQHSLCFLLSSAPQTDAKAEGAPRGHAVDGFIRWLPADLSLQGQAAILRRQRPGATLERS